MSETYAHLGYEVGPIVLRNNVSVHDLLISADIGVHPHEIGQPQRLLVSASLELGSIGEDSLEDTLDYNEVMRLAEKLGHERIALVETFASRLAEGLLAHPKVLEADVTIRKPGAFLAGIASARITLRRPAANWNGSRGTSNPQKLPRSPCPNGADEGATRMVQSPICDGG